MCRPRVEGRAWMRLAFDYPLKDVPRSSDRFARRGAPQPGLGAAWGLMLLCIHKIAVSCVSTTTLTMGDTRWRGVRQKAGAMRRTVISEAAGARAFAQSRARLSVL